ncbi:MAG: heavy metal translocating P-type ATPase metal-binding domain-containing protein [Sphingobacteriales bacterium]|nr:MAG: heavy metal translocating P-type ATPase metal-binding domain-containing protein [Sphingobacteriales bacterium]
MTPPVSVLPVTTKTACYHCGLDCETDDINLAGINEQDKKFFCCEGCKSVYEILNANDLCNYYGLENNPGITQRKPVSPGRFAYLDNEEVKTALLNFSDGIQSKVTFSIPQMHCSSCIWLLENLYKLNPAVSRSTVNFPRKELYLTFNESETTLKDIVILLASIGYEPDIRLGNLDSNAGINRKTSRQLTFKLGIAGFCFGNIMLLSFPEYLGLDNLAEGSFSRFFGYLNILLSLPVLLYSSTDYFKNAYSGLKQRTLNIDVPIALGIVALFGRSIFEILTHTGAGYLDSFAGLIFFLLTGRWFQQRTYDSISFERDYKSYFPVSATRIHQGQEESVALNDLETDDLILVRNEELIPADAVLTRGTAKIDYSFVTGESEPVLKNAGSLIYAGGRQVGAAIELRLVKKVSQSYLTELWNNDAFSENRTSTLTLLVNKTSRIFTPAILTVATLSGIYWWAVSGVPAAINVFTAVLIIACPCALALASPFTLGNALRILGRNRFYLKNTAVIEQTAQVNHIAFDKTGTITHAGHQEVVFVGDEIKKEFLSMIKSAVRQSGHPISRQIYNSLPDIPVIPVTSYKETVGKGISVQIYDCEVKIGSAGFTGFTEEEGNPAQQSTRTYLVINRISERDKTVLVKGYYLFQNVYRKGLKNVVEELGKNRKLTLISGDNDGEKNNLIRFFGNQAQLMFNQTPHHKLAFISELRKGGEKVLMFGDGLNDAGALRQADVGIAISESINNFSPACDAIVEASEFERLHLLLNYCVAAVKIVRFAFLISLSYNLVGLSIAVQGLLSPLVAAIFMPLSSVTVVLFGFLATNIVARYYGISGTKPLPH